MNQHKWFRHHILLPNQQNISDLGFVLKWLQTCPVIHLLLKPGNHHPIWWDSSEGNFYPRTPLIPSNYCISHRLLAPPQPLPGLTPIHPAEGTWSITLTSLSLKSSTHLPHCPVVVTWQGLVQVNPSICFLGPYPKFSKHGCGKSIQKHGLVFMDPNLSWATPPSLTPFSRPTS